jgi:hypothetical protein
MQPLLKSSFALIVAAGALAACGAGNATAPREEPLAAICARLDSAVATFGSYVTPDDQAAAVAATLPGGFGGYTRTADGAIAILLVEPGQLAAATATARRAAACAGAERVGALLAFVSHAAVALPGRYDYASLVRWYAQVSQAVVPLWADFVFSDITEDENRLTFGMATAAAADRVRAIVAELGIPAGAVNVLVTPRSGFGRAGG